MADGDMLEFSQVLSELQLSETELQGLIARGELRAFRSGGTMKFRSADVDMLRQDRTTEPTIIIPAASLNSDLNMDVPQDLGVDESAATVVPGGQSVGAATEEIVFEDSDLEILSVDDDLSVATAEVTVAAEAPVVLDDDDDDLLGDDDDEYDDDEAPRSSRRSQPSRAMSARSSAAYQAAPSDPIMLTCMVITSISFVFISTVLAVLLWKDVYSEKAETKFVPSYLQKLMPTK